jgi:DNA polymerase-3 subunit epsilon
LHGALLDARLLAEVFLAMTRGQESLLIDLSEGSSVSDDANSTHYAAELILLRASPEELAAHAAQIEDIDKASKGSCLWKKLQTHL